MACLIQAKGDHIKTDNQICATVLLRWLNLQAVSGNSRDGACFKLDKQT